VVQVGREGIGPTAEVEVVREVEGVTEKLE
jgi:hypothetical protein